MKPFEQVVAEHGPTVLRVCRAVLGPYDADDAWSETFLAALRAYPDLPEGSNIEAWLVTIAKHKAIDQHRSRRRRPQPVANPDPGSDPEPDAGADTAVTQGAGGARDREVDLWPALRSLPRKQREAIAYHHLAGLPYAQVADLLGNTESAARRAAADGMKALRRRYREPGSQPRPHREEPQGAQS